MTSSHIMKNVETQKKRKGQKYGDKGRIDPAINKDAGFA